MDLARARSPADFHGKVVVLHFVYASCPDFCPLHAEKLAEVQEMVNQTLMKDLVQFVSITSDPANDTPEVMRAYGPAHGIDPVNWVFLTVQDLRCCKPWKQVGTQALGLFAQPLAQAAKTDDVIAPVMHRPRHKQPGRAYPFLGCWFVGRHHKPPWS